MRAPLTIFFHLSTILTSFFCTGNTTNIMMSRLQFQTHTFILSLSSSAPLVSMPPLAAPHSPLPPLSSLSLLLGYFRWTTISFTSDCERATQTFPDMWGNCSDPTFPTLIALCCCQYGPSRWYWQWWLVYSVQCSYSQASGIQNFSST